MKYVLCFLVMLALLPSAAMAAVTVTVTQSGADSGSVIAGNTFTVTASGWSGDCSAANLDISGCPVCNLSESQSKSISGTSISWTTLTASKASSQSVTVSISGACTPDSGDTSFDVKNPPSLSATVASVSVTQGSSATFSINIQNNGETTAQFGTITSSGGSGLTLSDCSPSDIIGSQSLGLSCTLSASSSATTGAQTPTLSISPTNADTLTKTLSVAVVSSGGDDTPPATTSSGGGGGGGGGTTANKKTVSHKVDPPGLLNNTKLLAAIEKVLAKGKMNQNAVDNLVRLSTQISGQSAISRTINTGSTRSNVTTKIKYSGAKAAKNYVVYEKVPKSFANSSDLITVSVSGARVEVVEKDPGYAITFDTINPNQELAITYTISKSASVSSVDSFATEVYAESLVEPPVQQPPVQVQPTTPTQPAEQTTQQNQEPPQQDTQKEAKSNTGIIALVIILVLLVAGYLYIRKKQKMSLV